MSVGIEGLKRPTKETLDNAFEDRCAIEFIVKELLTNANINAQDDDQ